MTFWGGYGSGSADPCLWLMDPDSDMDPAIFVIVLTCTCWLTPRGSAGASQGVSLIIGPRHPRRQTLLSLLASWDGHHVPLVDFVGLLKSLGSLCLSYLAWDTVPSCRHSVREKVSPYLQPGCLDPNVRRIRSPGLPCICGHFKLLLTVHSSYSIHDLVHLHHVQLVSPFLHGG